MHRHASLVTGTKKLENSISLGPGQVQSGCIATIPLVDHLLGIRECPWHPWCTSGTQGLRDTTECRESSLCLGYKTTGLARLASVLTHTHTSQSALWHHSKTSGVQCCYPCCCMFQSTPDPATNAMERSQWMCKWFLELISNQALTTFAHTWENCFFGFQTNMGVLWTPQQTLKLPCLCLAYLV